jgi:hypothetical protein
MFLVMKADMLLKKQTVSDDLSDFRGPSQFFNLLSLNPLPDCGWAREWAGKKMLKMKSAPDSLLKTNELWCFSYDSMIWKELAMIFAAEGQDGAADCKWLGRPHFPASVIGGIRREDESK